MAVTGIKVKGEAMVGSIGFFYEIETVSSPGEAHAYESEETIFLFTETERTFDS